jgi:hypothetical protein
MGRGGAGQEDGRGHGVGRAIGGRRCAEAEAEAEQNRSRSRARRRYARIWGGQGRAHLQSAEPEGPLLPAAAARSRAGITAASVVPGISLYSGGTALRCAVLPPRKSVAVTSIQGRVGADAEIGGIS